jgi:hypothetical protein
VPEQEIKVGDEVRVKEEYWDDVRFDRAMVKAINGPGVVLDVKQQDGFVFPESVQVEGHTLLYKLEKIS